MLWGKNKFLTCNQRNQMKPILLIFQHTTCTGLLDNCMDG